LRQCTITTLSRAIARLNQRAREPLIINDADRFKSVGSGDHVFLWVPSSDQPLNQ
jgi:hypothetical protein